MASMETKRKTAVVVAEAAAQAALRRGPARDLSPDEERVIRMRLGAAPARTAPLEQAAEPLSDLEIELRSYEIEAYLKWKTRRAAQAPAAAAPVVAAPRPSRAKEKIIRALRRKS
jgi:DNA-directed RNA polymerase sigma subunit (sigma70/sigma32)